MKIRKKNRRKGGAAALFAATFLVMLFVGLDFAVRPAIKSVIEYQAKIFATKLINEEMARQLSMIQTDYSSLVKISRGSDGEITSIEADMARINTLKTRLSSAVVKKLEAEGRSELNVPLGTLIGNQLTSGRGPKVEIKIIPSGYVQAEIDNRFLSSGINQTLHQMMLNVNVQMIAILPGYSVKTETATNFCVAETVIVGKIPYGYADIDSGSPMFSAIER